MFHPASYRAAILLFPLLAFALPPAAALGQAQEEVTIESVELGGGVFLLTGQGGNLGAFVGEDGIFLIDDQFAPLTDKILAALAKLSPQPVRFVLNTHWHRDHTGGNENLGKRGAILVAHDNVRLRLSSEQFNEIFQRTTPPSPPGALPVVTFADAVTFHWNGDTVRAFHVEHAHTDGDVVVSFEKANVVHMGDLFFNGRYPVIDISSGGGVEGIIAGVDRVLGMIDDSTKVIPGHGPLGDKKTLQAYRNMLAEISGRVKSLIAQGKTLEEVKAAKPGGAYDANWGNASIKPDLFTEVLYRDLSRPAK